MDKGASDNDDSDDTAALLAAAVEEAKAGRKFVYSKMKCPLDKQVNIEALII